MSQPYDWTAARGVKWRDHLAAMEAMLQAVDVPLIRALRLNEPCRIADIGCGGGGTTQAIAQRAPAGSVVHGFDISTALVDVARTRTKNENITFEVANVATALMPQAPYDRLLSRFGTMFFSDPPAAFRQLSRWLKPNGRFVFAVWGPPADNPWANTVRDVVADVIALSPSVPDTPGPFRYAEASTLCELLQQAGLSDVETSEWRDTLPIGGGLPAEAAAHFALAAFSSFGEALAAAGAGALVEAQQALTKQFLPYQHNGLVQMAARVHILTGRKP